MQWSVSIWKEWSKPFQRFLCFACASIRQCQHLCTDNRNQDMNANTQIEYSVFYKKILRSRSARELKIESRKSASADSIVFSLSTVRHRDMIARFLRPCSWRSCSKWNWSCLAKMLSLIHLYRKQDSSRFDLWNNRKLPSWNAYRSWEIVIANELMIRTSSRIVLRGLRVQHPAEAHGCSSSICAICLQQLSEFSPLYIGPYAS